MPPSARSWPPLTLRSPRRPPCPRSDRPCPAAGQNRDADCLYRRRWCPAAPCADNRRLDADIPRESTPAYRVYWPAIAGLEASSLPGERARASSARNRQVPARQNRAQLTGYAWILILTDLDHLKRAAERAAPLDRARLWAVRVLADCGEIWACEASRSELRQALHLGHYAAFQSGVLQLRETAS